jgi:NSS family neurotransmitter:Na+ symporter
MVQSMFGVFFFLMLLGMGIDSAFSLVEAIVSGLRDSFGMTRKMVTFWVCFTGFGIGTVYATGAGLYWLDIVDHWMSWSLILVGLLQALLMGWFVDTRKVSKDIDSTSEIKFGRLWDLSIRYITPLALTLIILANQCIQ